MPDEYERAREAGEENDKLLEVDLHEDRTREFRTPAFSRMQTDWDGPHKEIVRDVIDICEGRLNKKFFAAFLIINELRLQVRTAIIDRETGEHLRNARGELRWRTNEFGIPEEDYSRLTRAAKIDFLHKISVGLAEWEQEAANMWGEAMLAKAEWEERFAGAYTEAKGTDKAKENASRTASMNERYLGIIQSLMSRKADALVRSLRGIDQRLKDTLDV